MTEQTQPPRLWTTRHDNGLVTLKFVTSEAYGKTTKLSDWVEKLQAIAAELPPCMAQEVDLIATYFNLDQLLQALAVYARSAGFKNLAVLIGKPETEGFLANAEDVGDDSDHAKTELILNPLHRLQIAIHKCIQASSLEPISATGAYMKIKANYSLKIADENIRVTDPKYWHLTETLQILQRVAAYEMQDYFSPDDSEKN